MSWQTARKSRTVRFERFSFSKVGGLPTAVDRFKRVIVCHVGYGRFQAHPSQNLWRREKRTASGIDQSLLSGARQSTRRLLDKQD